jgi:translation initiation factor IF-2
VNEVTNGNECGMKLDTTVTPEVGDVIEVYQTEEKARKLEKAE